MLPAELRQRNLSSASYTHAHKNDRGGASDRNERARNPMIHDTKLLCASQEGNSQQSPAPSATKTDHATSNSFVHVNTDQLQLVLQTVMTPQERRIKQQTNWSHTNKKCQQKQKKRNRCACINICCCSSREERAKGRRHATAQEVVSPTAFPVRLTTCPTLPILSITLAVILFGFLLIPRCRRHEHGRSCCLRERDFKREGAVQRVPTSGSISTIGTAGSPLSRWICCCISWAFFLPSGFTMLYMNVA